MYIYINKNILRNGRNKNFITKKLSGQQLERERGREKESQSVNSFHAQK